MDRTAQYPVAQGQRAASGHITTPPAATNNMIGPSPSYVPNGYNDAQALFYARGGYPQPQTTGASNGTQYFPPPNVYGTTNYLGQGYDQRYASPEQQAPTVRHSVSPRTGYEGWKEATTSTYSGLPNTNADQPMESMQGGYPSTNAMNLAQLSQSSPNGSGSSPYHQIQQQSSPYGQSLDGFSSPPVQDTSHFSIHTSPPTQQTTSPETAYYSSPTQMYDNGARLSISQQPILFSSADQKPLAHYLPPQPAADGRKIAGNARVQQRMNSISTNAMNAATTEVQNPPGALRQPGGGSGFSSHSGLSSGSANYAFNAANPYLGTNGHTAPAGAAQVPNKVPTASTSAAAVAQASSSPPNRNKRPRHSQSDSLSVPTWQRPRPSGSNQTSTQAGGAPISSVLGSYTRFDSSTWAADGLDSEDSEDSEEDEEPAPVQASSKGGRGGKGGKGKAGKKNEIPPGMARKPGACKNCKRLKMRCVFESDFSTKCNRCRDGNKECIVEGRKQRQPSNKREQLMNLLREKEKTIDRLLRMMHNPAKLLATGQGVGLRAPSPSNQSRDASGSNQGLPASGSFNFAAPLPSPTAAKDIEAWVSAANARAQSTSPRKSDTGLMPEGSSDEEEAVGRTGVIDIDARERSVPVSDGGAMDSISQRGDRADTLSTASSAGMLAPKEGKERRLSAGDPPKMHSVPDVTAPHGLFAELSIESQTAEEREAERERQRKRLQSISTSSLGSAYNQEKNSLPKDPSDPPAPSKDLLEDEALGPANKNYWRPGPAQNLAFRRLMNERNPPELLAMGFINLEDVDKLFKIFYDRLNVFLSILDPVIHTPVDVFGRSPFLFTAVCAVASRYYTEKPHIYSVAMHYARTAAAMALVEGVKSVETCQAYIIMSVYPTPARRWEEDRSWLYLRLAIGMATDLSLHIPSSTVKFLDERHEREILNRTRTWIICFNLDRSGATQFGKPPSIKEDSVIRRSPGWYKSSVHNHCYDIHMVAYTELLRLVASFLEEVYSDPNSPTGLNKELNFAEVTTRYDSSLGRFMDETAQRFGNESDQSDPACRYRTELLPFLVHYSRLVMFSFGFQQAFQRGKLERGNKFLVTCVEAASSVLRTVVETLAPSGYLRYAADGHFVFAAFASAFLLKVLRPPFATMLEPDQRTRILALVNRVIRTLGSPEVAVDDHHTPKLYSRFLDGLLKRNQEASNSAAISRAPAEPSVPAPLPTIDTVLARATAPPSSEKRPMSPTIKVQAPDEEIQTARPTSLMDAVQNTQSQLLGGNIPYHNDNYAYSVTASSTIDAPRDTATQYSNEDILMADDPNWIATMNALENPAFWTNGMLPGFQWPSPPEGSWQPALTNDSQFMTDIPQQPEPTQQQMFASLMHQNQASHLR